MRHHAGSPMRRISHSSSTPLLLEHAAAHLLAQRLDVGGGRVAEIDQEVAVLLGDLRVADAQAAAAGAVDQLPRLVAGRIGEGRAAGAAARLGLGARGIDLGDAARDGELVAGRRAQARRGEDPVGRRRCCGDRRGRARPASRCGCVPARSTASAEISTSRQLAAIGAGIGREGAADRAGNAAQELEAGQRMVARRQRHVEIGRAGAGHDLVALDRDAGEAAHQADHHALDAAVAHQQVRADAQHRHRHVGRQRLQERRQILGIGRPEQHLGRAAGAEPGLRAERRIGRQPAARLGQPVDQVRMRGLRAPSCRRSAVEGRGSLAMARGPACSAAICWSWPGSACAQAVMLPAPRQTTTSPGRAICQIRPGRSPGAPSGVTSRWPARCTRPPACRD